jgi:hypothetical protein
LASTCSPKNEANLSSFPFEQCDEKRPLCGNCAKRFPGNSSCIFLHDRVRTRVQGSEVDQTLILPVSFPKTIIQRPNHMRDSDAGRHFESRLVYHYTGTLQSSLPDHGDESGRSVWEFDIPQMAHNDKNCLGAVCCLSAIHLRTLCPEDQALKEAAGYYFGQTVTRHLGHIRQRNLESIDPSRAQTLIITALILIYYTWQASLDQPRFSSTYSLPMEVFLMEKGFFELIGKLYPGGIGLAKHCQWLLHQEYPPNVDDTVTSTRFFDTFRNSLNRIKAAIPSDVNPVDDAEYRWRVQFNTNICYELTTGVPQERVRRALVMTVSHCSDRYIGLLREHDPIALALFAHALALVHVTSHVWWLHGPKDLHLESFHVRGILGLMPHESLWMMQWPKDVVDNRITLEAGSPESFDSFFDSPVSIE